MDPVMNQPVNQRFQENPPEGYFRLGAIGSEVKLRHSYVPPLKRAVGGCNSIYRGL